MKSNAKKILLLILSCMMLFSALPVMATENPVFAEFYIDPVNGNDSFSGSKEAPFKSVERATEAVSKLYTKMKGDIYVWFNDGRYELTDTVRFEQRTGGKGDYKVYYKAVHGAKPVISGGKKITGWELHDEEKNIYKAQTGGVYSRHLTVNGELATRARSEYKGKDTSGLIDELSDYGKVGIECGNIEMLDWKNKSDVELVFICNFKCNRIMATDIVKVDDETVKIILEDKHWQEEVPIGTLKWAPVSYVENAYELIDSEGEFYIDRTEGYVYYKPFQNQDMETAECSIPVLEELFKVGGYDYYAKTKNIVFDGLSFTDSTWMFPTTDRGFVSAQDGYLRRETKYSGTDKFTRIPPGALNIAKTNNIEVLNCSFYALGSAGIRVLDGTQDIDIIGNLIKDTGCGGMYIGSVESPEINPDDTRRIVMNVNVLNNYIHHVAIDNRASAGLSIGYPYNCTIMHNEIHDVPYSGVHTGWGWGAVQRKTLENLKFEYNYIHDFMKGWGMSDGGGIYNVGYTSATIENPNRICNNYFKDCYSGSVSSGGMIYLDNTSSHFLIEGNVLDNLEGSKVWDGSPFAMTSYTPKNDFWRNNYSTKKISGYKSRIAENIIFENNNDHPTANWPAFARNVIKNSGLEPQYRHLSPRSTEYEKVFTDEFVNLDMGDTFKLNPVATTEFCEEVSMANAEIKYTVADENIASIDENGLITAIFEGQTKIITEVTIDGVTNSAQTTVSVGSGLASVKLGTNLNRKIVIGETKEFPTVVGINFGGTEIDGTLENITFKSSDENILAIDSAAKTITAKNYGDVTLSFSGTFEGVTRSADFNMTVVDYADQSGLNYPTMTLDEMYADEEGWYVESGTMTPIQNGYAFNETTVVSYTTSEYGNVLYDFYLSMDRTAVWPSITLGATEEAVGFNETNSFYIFCLAKTGIELQRFNGNTRTSIFCNLLPATRIGPTHPMILTPNQKYHFQVGLFDEPEGTRIVLNIDGKNIINYVDETEGRVDATGFFGLMINNTTFNITTK